MRQMSESATNGVRYTSEQYFRLAEKGIIDPDERVELLEGLIVAMSPHSPRHASATTRVYETLRRAVAGRAVIRVQLPLVCGTHSAPEPDIAVVSGTPADYDLEHPQAALLVVEIADSSLLEDRLTKAHIYAAASVPEYWIVNLRADLVEVFRTPDSTRGGYQERRAAERGDELDLLTFPQARVSVTELLPRGRK
jgi:Uma2 family endonuclease